MFKFEFDDGAGILIVRVLGVWTMPEIERYGREAGSQFRSARFKAGSLRLLVDCSGGHICPRDLVEPLGRAGMQHSRGDDRAAMVVGSSLSKLQVKRMSEGAPAQIFNSEREARIWLAEMAAAGRQTAAAA